MRIEIVNKIDDETNEVYGFNLFDLTAVFVIYHKETKPKGKRKYKITEFWDKYSRQSTIIEPFLPTKIKEDALKKVTEYITVKTWNEFKP